MSALFIVRQIFPLFINEKSETIIREMESLVKPILRIPINEPLLDVTSGIVFAFMFGLGISYLRQHSKRHGDAIYNVFSDFSDIISYLLGHLVVPGIPIFCFW